MISMDNTTMQVPTVSEASRGQGLNAGHLPAKTQAYSSRLIGRATRLRYPLCLDVDDSFNLFLYCFFYDF